MKSPRIRWNEARQSGLTMVELLVSVVISSLIVIAATSFFVGTSRSRDTQDAAAQLEDNARFVTEIITRNLQQTGYQNYRWDPDPNKQSRNREVVPPVDGEPDIRGYNNSSAGTSLDNNGAHDCTGTCATNRVASSDTLVIRFQGSSTAAGVADSSMIDCLGGAQPATTLTDDRLYSIFELRRSSATNEPELRCKRRTSSGSVDTQPIASGVETFQVMYGVDRNNDSFVDQWLNGKEIDALAGTAIDKWSRVRSVRVGMVLRSPTRVGLASAAASYKPLGDNFTASADPGSTLTVSDDGRLRRVVTFTVNLRNAL